MTLVVGDVHGCAEELAQLVREVQPERVVLVGDLFTKGPDPAGVWSQIRDGAFEATLGNHDERLLAVLDARREDAAAAEVVARLDASDPSWAPWLRALPLFVDAAGFTVVHAGLHPSGDLEATTREMALYLRRWPDDRDPRNPFWYQVYQGTRRVLFGHDAVRGLVRVERQGRPHIVGLDTGCVYGGLLTGYVPEEDRIVQVRARAVWHDPHHRRPRGT